MFRRLLGRRTTVTSEAILAPTNLDPHWYSSDGWLAWEAPLNLVVGESYRQEVLLALTGPPRQGGYLVPVPVMLCRETDNQYDQWAARVEAGGQQVGYLSRELAARVGPVIDVLGCAEFSVAGVIRVGSPDAPSLGVHLWPARRLTPGPTLELFIPADREVSWPPGFSEENTRRRRTSRRPKDPLDAYDWIERKIDDAWEDRDFDRLLALSDEALTLLNQLIGDGELDPPDVPEDVPGLAQAARFLAARGDRSGLDGLKSKMESVPWLRPVLSVVDEEIGNCDFLQTIRNHLGEHPGTLQKDLHEHLGIEKARTRELCYWAESAGTLRREKKGITYALYLPEFSPDN